MLPDLSSAPTYKAWGFPTLQSSVCSCHPGIIWLTLSPTIWVQADRSETKKGCAHLPPPLGGKNPAQHSQGWWHEESTKHTHGSVLGLLSICCPLRQLLGGQANTTAALRTMQLERQQGRAGISPLPTHHYVYLLFVVNNNPLSQSWAHVELMLSAHVCDKTVDLSELSPTNRWGNWSTRTSHRVAALMPCS